MTAQLASIIDLLSSKDPSNFQSFFSAKDRKKISNEYVWPRECTDNNFPPSCNVNLFFGFFFDGTNNNLKLDRESHAYSNVARLYQAFPGGRDQHGSEAWPELKTKYHNSFFRTYVPGVGTEFEEVNDSGKGFSLTEDRPKGLGFCYLGENRIIWAMVEAINNVSRYYTDTPLIDSKKFKTDFNHLTLPGFGETTARFHANDDGEFKQRNSMKLLEAAFTNALQRLHEKLKLYLPTGPQKSREKGVVTAIYVSMFGFSRGATKARAFSNWFIWLCRLDAKIAGGAGMSMGAIPVTIDFLGLFDTVASVGLAASALIADGHQAWADAEVSLRIPIEPTQCLHLVSAHEIRRSFPLDSVLYEADLPPNCKEIVFPGVHSDIGGGYAPLEQGRGKHPEGDDLISRIPLATMYRAARLAGVPLKLEEAPESVKRAFRMEPSVIQAFNAYIEGCRQAHGITKDEPMASPLHKLMEQQHKLYVQWRKKMLGKMAQLRSVQDSDAHAREDVLDADKELVDEVGYFQSWRRNQFRGEVEMRPTVPEWQDIDRYWDDPAPAAAITDFFEQFVHDSRACFKPLGKDIPDLQHHMDMLSLQNEKAREWEVDHPGSMERNPYALTSSEKAKLNKYMLYKDKPNFRDGLDPESKGREPMWLGAGFLRYRRIYMGSDSFKPHGAHYAGLAPSRGVDRHDHWNNEERMQVA